MSINDMLTGFGGKLISWMQLVKALPFDGGPSATRFTYVLIAFVISGGWVGLVVGAVIVYLHTGKIDTVYCALIVTLGTALIGFTQNAHTQKLTLDAKAEPGVKSDD